MRTRAARIFFWLLFFTISGWSIFLRTWAVGTRPFWMDEAWVASAVRGLSFRELLFQTELPMPPLFAVAVKLTSFLPGATELSLRLLPMLSGIGCVLLTYAVLRTLRIPRFTSLAGMAFCASSLMLVIWSRELKQYEIEAFLSALLALLVFRIRRTSKQRTRRAYATGIILVCLFGPWLGYGFVFSGVVLMCVLVVLRPLEGPRRTVVVLGFVGLAVLACSMFMLWQMVVAKQAGQQALLDYTKGWFVDAMSSKSWVVVRLFGLSSTVMMTVPFELAYSHIRMAPLLGGLIWLLTLWGLLNWPGKGRAEMSCWVIGPWLLLLTAAIAGKYPFGQRRVMVFLAGPLLLGLAMGLVLTLRSWSLLLTGRTGPGVVSALLLILAGTSNVICVPLKHSFWVKHDFPALLSVLEKHKNKGELVLATQDAVVPLRYYCGEDKEDFVLMPICAGTLQPPGFNFVNFVEHALADAGHDWWIVSSTGNSFGEQLKEVIQVARRRGYRVELVFEAGGSRTYGVAQLYKATLRRQW